jgi:hypothetical protein
MQIRKKVNMYKLVTHALLKTDESIVILTPKERAPGMQQLLDARSLY